MPNGVCERTEATKKKKDKINEMEYYESLISGKLMEERLKKIMIDNYNKKIKYDKNKKMKEK